MADNQGTDKPHRKIDKSGIQVPVVAIDIGGTGVENLWTGAGGGGGSGTEYTEDAAAPADPVGGVTQYVRKDTPAAVTSTDGDIVTQRGTNFGASYVTLLDTGGSPVAVGGGTQYTEGDIDATITGTAMLWEDVSDTLRAVSAVNRLPVSTGNVVVIDGGGSLTVDAAELTTLAGGVRAGDAASADAHTGIPAMAVRKATPANTSGADGDYEMLQVNAGRLWVDPSGVTLTVASHNVTNAGTFAVQADTELTVKDLDSGVGTDNQAVVGLVVPASGGSVVITGDVANGLDVDVTRVSGTVTVGDGGGAISVDDNAGSLTVDAPVGTPVFVRLSDGASAIATLPVSLASAPTTPVTLAAGATAIAKAEDVASADADVGVPAMMVRKATPANTSNADGDYEFLQGSAGRLWVDASGVTLTVASHAVTNAGTFLVQAVGNVAEDAAISGNPVLTAVRAHSGVPTAMSADNDIVIPWADRSGALAVIPQVRQVRLSATPTIATSGYVDNDQIGGLMTFTGAALASGRPGLLVGASITSRTVVSNPLELWIFEASPTVASTDNAAFDLTDANLEAARPTAVIDFAAADYRNTASGVWVLGTVKGGKVSEPFVTSGSANLFGVLVANGTPAGQYAGTTDIVVALEIQQF